jgi:hypothetical protein
MKHIGKLACLLVSFLLVVACSDGAFAPEETRELESVEEMEIAAQRTLDLYLDAAATGDLESLESFLQSYGGEEDLGAILKDQLTVAPAPRWTGGYEAPPAFDDDVYEDGDILLFSGTGTINGILFNLILINAYGHAGIVDREVVDTTTEYSTGTPCILSACLPEGVRYQTYDELYLANETWALVRVGEGDLAQDWGQQFSGQFKVDTTAYSFLHLNFTPVTKDDPYWWYCSKVPYRVWQDMVVDETGDPVVGGVNVEAADFYQLSEPDGIWTAQRESILYKIYAYWYSKLPRWLRRFARTPDSVLKTALAELVSADELRMSGEADLVEVWGDLSPEIFLDNL